MGRRRHQWVFVTMDEAKKKLAGLCDYGFMKAEEPDSAAQNALFLMAVGIKKSWSYPNGYFLTNKMSSDVLTQIVWNKPFDRCWNGSPCCSI